MKKMILLMMIACLFPALTLAQSTKIGVVNAEVVVQKSSRGKAFFEELSAFRDSKTAEIEGLAKSFNDMQKDAQAKAASLSDEKKQEISMELQKMQTDIKRKREDAERESQLKINTGLEAIQKELMPLVRQVALERGLDMVINVGGGQSGVVFFSENVDITDDVIKKYDEMKN